MNRLEFAKKVLSKGSEWICEERLSACHECMFRMEVPEPPCNQLTRIPWAQKVIAEEQLVEHAYKVDDKIKIPHAEELLLKGWKLSNTGDHLIYNGMESMVKVIWCGKEVTITGVANYEDFYLRIADFYHLHPEHLGLPKIKQKVKRSGWVNVYPPNTPGQIAKVYAIMDTEENANAQANPTRIDCVKIEWSE